MYFFTSKASKLKSVLLKRVLVPVAAAAGAARGGGGPGLVCAAVEELFELVAAQLAALFRV